MDFCHISPTKYLTTFCSNQRSHLLLAHLVEDDPVYRQWYIDNKKANPNVTYIPTSESDDWFYTTQTILSTWSLVLDTILFQNICNKLPSS